MYKAELEEVIEGVKTAYFGVCTELYGTNSACRGAFLLADNPPDYWVHHVLVADLIIKNENRTWAYYIPLIEESVNAVLSHKSECELSPEDWEKITEKNLRYVAYTRPKKVLGFIKEERGDKRKNPYSGTSIKEEVNAIRNMLNFKPFDFDKISTEPTTIINQPKVSNISTTEAKPNCKKGGLKFVNLMKKD